MFDLTFHQGIAIVRVFVGEYGGRLLMSTGSLVQRGMSLNARCDSNAK